ncbi:ANTAR domain-containing protein [Xylanimonas sp. McL0601]|uniref:ANTAR domain-containing protein n=1 Tax=Xylanimonas sp. McL0601 TaxID=3414739 RepID=UPI003CF0C9DF
MGISKFPHDFATRCAAVLGRSVEASITVRQLGVTVRAGSSSDAAARCDQAEAVSGVGPCIEAMDKLVAQIVPEVALESRWELWRTRASEEGFVSAVAVPAVVGPGISVALNLYSKTADPWDSRLLTAADSYAQLVASAFRLRLRLAEVEDGAVGLYRNLSDDKAVERAVGAIMQTNQCTEHEARNILESATRNRKVSRREVAESLLRSLVVPDDGPEPVGDLFAS